ncbi:MAG: YggS family pyridoxal phosphate-dependent enzyme [Clostridia bacterium]|nr:YggS family pyridoxal phosphate-dependent enzyme [Clostridia bacterium]
MGILENIKEVNKKIENAAKSANRDKSEVTLIGVSKTKPVSLIKEAVECGIEHLGENRVQEIMEKFDHIKGAKWHLIGHLQKNKVKYIVDKVELIHSVDSLELAKEIDKQAKKIGKVQSVLIQVNISGEESKFGLPKEEVIPLLEEVKSFENVKVKGLMTMAPLGAGEDELREIFGGLKKLSIDIREKNIDNISMEELSMGMSGDFEIAVSEGATMVRVGTGIFGHRE